MPVIDRGAITTDIHEVAAQLAKLVPRRHALMRSGHEWHLATFDVSESRTGGEPRIGWVTIDSDISLGALLVRQYDRVRATDGRTRRRKPAAATDP